MTVTNLKEDTIDLDDYKDDVDTISDVFTAEQEESYTKNKKP